MKILLLILLIFTVFVDAAKGQVTSTIKLKYTTREYCSNPVLVAEGISIEGFPGIAGMKISISQGFISGEDELIYTGALLQSRPAPGTLELTGSADVRDYVAAIGTVTYKNNKTNPTPGIRKITISLNDVDYLWSTEHFYRFVPKTGIKWTDAEAEAKSDAMKYYGLRGYLATIKSGSENYFINSKLIGVVGWIGASDAAVEGEWRWVTGPEGLEDGGKGLLFWKGSGYQAKMNNSSSVYGPVKDPSGIDYYHNWNRWEIKYSSSLSTLTWEPNDYQTSQDHEEDYAHITYSTNLNETLKWNDYPNNSGSAGYLIEFGGTEGDPMVNLSATLDLQVNTIVFNTDPISAICEGTSVTLNQPDLYTIIPASYAWTPSESLSRDDIANPVATPTFPSSTYTVTGTRGNCSSGPIVYTVPVNPKPVSMLNAEENICKGNSITLDAGFNSTYTYKWDNGPDTQKYSVEAAGDYKVKLSTDKGCDETFPSKVIVHEYPTIDILNIQKLICGDEKATTVNITSNSSSYTLTSGDGRASVSDGLTVTVPNDGVYPMVYTANHQFCPISEPFNLSFYKNPEGALTVDGQLPNQPCFGYNLNATFTPANDLTGANYEWNFGGELIASEVNLNSQVIPLGIDLLRRDLNLKVTRDGCSNTFTEPGILVRPNLSLTVDQFGKVCAPLDVVFTATSEGAIKFDWDTGDKIFSGLTSNQLYTYKDAGLWDVILKVTTADDCKNEVKIPKMVHVAPVPVVTFSLSPTDCLEPGTNEISFTGTGLNGTGNDHYIWDLNDFNTSEQLNNPQETPGPFKFDLITKPNAKIGLQVISEFGCESTNEYITLQRKPDFSIDTDFTAGCVLFKPTLSGVINEKDVIDKVDFNWTFTDGSTGSGSPYSPTFNDPGKTYSVTLKGISSETLCPNEVFQSDLLRTYPKPKAEFSIDNAIVYNDKPDVNFTDRSEGAIAWIWEFGDKTTSVLQNPSYHFVKMGNQRVLLEVTNGDLCTDTVSLNVLVAFNLLFPPTGFSPNAPNVIDREFKLGSEGIASEGYHFTILSRWNDLVFEARNEIKGWNGQMPDESLAPAGTYIWILNFTDFLGRRHRQTGTVTLVY